jgi:hypothetical protein
VRLLNERERQKAELHACNLLPDALIQDSTHVENERRFQLKNLKSTAWISFEFNSQAVNGSNNARPLGYKRAKPYIFNKKV